MIAIQATEDEVRPHLTDRVGIAAVNGPQAVVISGDADAAQAVADQFNDRKSTRLKVSHAFHSVLMEPMLDEFRAIASGLTYHQPSIPIVSGELADVTTSVYWVNHVRDAVRFAASVTFLEAHGVTRFLELGPDAILAGMAQTSPSCPILRRNRDEATTAVSATRPAVVVRYPVDWATFFAGTGAKKVDLPTYAFQHERYWLTGGARRWDASGVRPDRRRPPAARRGRSSLAGRRRACPHVDGLARHPRRGSPTTTCSAASCSPAPGFVELAIQRRRPGRLRPRRELTLQAPLVLPEQGGRSRCRSPSAAPDETGAAPSASTPAPADDPWLRHADGLLAPVSAAPRRTSTAVAAAGRRDLRRQRRLRRPARPRATATARCSRASRRPGRSATTSSPRSSCPRKPTATPPASASHPALLDAAMHALIVSGGGERRQTRAALRLDGVRCTPPGARRCGSGSPGPTTTRSPSTSPTPRARPCCRSTRSPCAPISAEQLGGSSRRRPVRGGLEAGAHRGRVPSRTACGDGTAEHVASTASAGEACSPMSGRSRTRCWTWPAAADERTPGRRWWSSPTAGCGGGRRRRPGAGAGVGSGALGASGEPGPVRARRHRRLPRGHRWSRSRPASRRSPCATALLHAPRAGACRSRRGRPSGIGRHRADHRRHRRAGRADRPAPGHAARRRKLLLTSRRGLDGAGRRRAGAS